MDDSRAPRGARGLKFLCNNTISSNVSRAPRGARGLKYNKTRKAERGHKRRAPRGARGLKSKKTIDFSTYRYVAPLAGRVD